ncbi:MAG: UDP-N-acetylmuramoyl-L-alanyl-D-glutamate--2,6-diaminopimelate ligase [Anaerolineae bacterium]|nr:UDP-N-acetylmuramoyl-L-alanyl-D-glutamate--2,6-diaminopimelate ligase [Anaerolineae bacterium]
MSQAKSGPRRLRDLLQDVKGWRPAGTPEGPDPSAVAVAGFTEDSREVRPGFLFVAIPGVHVDGCRFVPDALARGAAAVVSQREPPAGVTIPWVVVPNARAALAHIAAAWYGHPGRQMRVVGVTGTDGKTTTATLIHAALDAAGWKAALITTVQAQFGAEAWDTGLHTTTPDAPDLQRLLAEVRDRGAEAVVLEVTSHGLAQHRVDGSEFDVAVLTNVTSEHLDYHGTWEEYRAAKGRLFQLLSRSVRKPGVPKVAVLNRDDPSYDYFRAFAADAYWSYGFSPEADVRAEDVAVDRNGVRFLARTPLGEVEIRSPLPGRFNAHNLLAALAAALAQGIGPEDARRGLEAVRGVPGRMDRVDLGQPFDVVVDFAHTPNALARALETARAMTQGRVIVVFGCAGLRDWEKRPRMGAVAARLADLTVLTAEDPRTESLEAILEAIAAGCREAGGREGETFWRVPDRAEAIRKAMGLARPGDLVLITGKGHERSMCFGTEEVPWSDHEAARAALEALGYGKGTTSSG